MIQGYGFFVFALALILIITGIVYLFLLAQEDERERKERETIYRTEMQSKKCGIVHNENKTPAYYRVEKFESAGKE